MTPPGRGFGSPNADAGRARRAPVERARASATVRGMGSLGALVIFLLAAGILAACPSPDASSGAGADSVTQRQRYEAVGESNLPGSQGVRGALDASDDIRAREARRDSILRGQ